jgi:hypothetical protein
MSGPKLAQVYKVVACNKDEATDETVSFSVIGRDLEDAKKKGKTKARSVLDKITSFKLSETEADKHEDTKADPKQADLIAPEKPS